MVSTDTPSCATPSLHLHSSVHSDGEHSHSLSLSKDRLNALSKACGYIAAALRFREDSQGEHRGDTEVSLDTGSCDPRLAAEALLYVLGEVEPSSPAPHCHPILLTPSSATSSGALPRSKSAAQGSSWPETPTASTVPASVFQPSHTLTDEQEPSSTEVAPDQACAPSGLGALSPGDTQQPGQGAHGPAPCPASAPEVGYSKEEGLQSKPQTASSVSDGPDTHKELLPLQPQEDPAASRGSAAAPALQKASSATAAGAAHPAATAAEQAAPAVQASLPEAAEAAQPAAASGEHATGAAEQEEGADSCFVGRTPPVIRAQAAGHGQLEVTPANVASLLCLADQWDIPRLRGRVLRELRHSPLFCGGLRKPYAVGTPAMENVPQVLMLLEQAIPFVGDTEGGLKSLQADCLMWLAENAVRTWPTRAFASLPSAIQKRVLHQAISNLKVHGALGALLRCQHLQAAIPQGLTWAAGVADLAVELREATLTFIWDNFVPVVCSPSLRKDLAEPWSAEVLAEVSAFAKVQGSPTDAIKALMGWPQVQRKMGTWEELPHLQEAVSAFYADLRAHASKHFGAVSSSIAFKALPARQQQQLMADLQVVHLTSRPPRTREPLRPDTNRVNKANGSAEHGHGEQGEQIGEGGLGTHKGGTMFIIADTLSPAAPSPTAQRPTGPRMTSASLAARQRREAAAAAAAAGSASSTTTCTPGNIPRRPHRSASSSQRRNTAAAAASASTFSPATSASGSIPMRSHKVVSTTSSAPESTSSPATSASRKIPVRPRRSTSNGASSSSRSVAHSQSHRPHHQRHTLSASGSATNRQPHQPQRCQRQRIPASGSTSPGPQPASEHPDTKASASEQLASAQCPATKAYTSAFEGTTPTPHSGLSPPPLSAPTSASAASVPESVPASAPASAPATALAASASPSKTTPQSGLPSPPQSYLCAPEAGEPLLCSTQSTAAASAPASAALVPESAPTSAPATASAASASASNTTPQSELPPPTQSGPCAPEAAESLLCSTQSTAAASALASASESTPASSTTCSSAGCTAGSPASAPSSSLAAAAAASKPLTASSTHSKPMSRIPQVSNKLLQSSSTAASIPSPHKHAPSKQSHPRHPSSASGIQHPSTQAAPPKQQQTQIPKHPSTSSGIPYPHKHASGASALPIPDPNARRRPATVRASVPGPLKASPLSPARRTRSVQSSNSKDSRSNGTKAPCSDAKNLSSSNTNGSRTEFSSIRSSLSSSNGAKAPSSNARDLSSNGAKDLSNRPSSSNNNGSHAELSSTRSSLSSSDSRRRDEPSRMIPESKNSYLGSLRACKAAALSLADSGSS